MSSNPTIGLSDVIAIGPLFVQRHIQHLHDPVQEAMEHLKGSALVVKYCRQIAFVSTIGVCMARKFA